MIADVQLTPLILLALRDQSAFRAALDGYRVIEGADGDSILALCDQQSPQAILLEQNLPVLDGLEICRRLRAAHGDNLVIFFVLREMALVDQALEAGADDVVSLPLAPSLLRRRLKTLLDARIAPPKSGEHKYRDLFNSANDAILIIDAQTRQIFDGNSGALHLLDYTHEELVKLTLDNIAAVPEEQPYFLNQITYQGSMIFEQNYRRKSGTVLPVEISSTLINYEGKPAFLHIIRDISQRRKTQETERQQWLLAKALRESATAIGGTLELDLVLSRVLASVEMVVTCDAANIMIVENGIAHVTAWRGYDRLGISSEEWLSLKLAIETTSTLRWITEHNQSLCISDTRQYADWFMPPKDNWIMSYVGAPIIINDQVVGFLNLDSATPRHFTERDANNLQAFADQAAIAIQNANLYKSAQLHADALEHRVQQRTEQLSIANNTLREQINERQLAEEALAQERNLLRTLIDTLLDEVYVKDLEGRLVLVNEPMRQRLQKLLPGQDIIGTTVYEYTSKHRADDLDAENHKIMETGQPVINQEVSIRDGDGNIRWKLNTRVPLRDSKRQIIGLIGINHDITELRGTEERLLHVVMGANCLLWYATVEFKNGEYLWNGYVSSDVAAQRFLPIEIPAGMTYMQAWHQSVLPEDRPRIDEIAHKALENRFNGYSQEFRCRHIDGEIRWLYEEVRIREISRTRWSLVGVCTDITGRKKAAEALQHAHDELELRVVERTSELMRANAVLKEQIIERQRAEQALRESEARFRALVEHAPEAIVVFDAETEQFIDANENAARLFGVARQQLLKRGPMDFSPPQQPDGVSSVEAMRANIEHAVKGETPVFEWMYRNVRGINIPCEVRLLLLTTSNSLLIRGSITDITARKQAEAALQQSQEKYRSLINQLPLGVYRTNPEGILLHGNPTLATILGYKNIDEMIGISVFEFYENPQDRIDMFDSYHKMKGGISQLEMRLHTHDGRAIWVKNIGRSIFDQNGEIAYVDGTLEDITEWKRVQQAEQEQRLLARALQDAASDLTRTLDLDEVLDRILIHITRVMPSHESAAIMLLDDQRTHVKVIRYLHHTSYGLDTIPRRVKFELREMPELHHMYATGQPLANPNLRDNIHWVGDFQPTTWIQSYIGAPIQAEGQVIGFIALASATADTFTEDHAHRLLAFANQVGIAIQNARLFTTVQNHAMDLRYRIAERTAELEHERVRLRAILDAMTEGVIYYEMGDAPVYTNRSLSQLTGYDESEWADPNLMMKVMNKTQEDFEKWQMTVTETLHRLGLWRSQVKLQRKKGHEFDASLITTRVINGEGQMVGVVTVMRDISQEKVLESQKARFIANASHELRTPIANLKTRLYLMRRQPEKWEEHLPILESVTNRMRKLVEDLLDVSRFEHGIIPLELSKTAIQAPIIEVVTTQQPEAQRRGQTLTFEVPDRPVYVNMDVSRFMQVITNLVTNAINYTGEGGEITVKIEIDGDDVYTRVIDNGPGISPELLPNVFKPFFRGNEHNVGTGLGLSIAREIVDLHGGELTVESTVGVGSCFTVHLKRTENR